MSQRRNKLQKVVNRQDHATLAVISGPQNGIAQPGNDTHSQQHGDLPVAFPKDVCHYSCGKPKGQGRDVKAEDLWSDSSGGC
jgi:hypothetical protein